MDIQRPGTPVRKSPGRELTGSRPCALDAPDHSNAESLHRLNIDFVQQNGYANLRCIDVPPGCPDEVQPFCDPPKAEYDTKQEMGAAWSYIFPEVPVPPFLAVACCSQFVVSREQILKRPRTFYLRVRQWVVDTKLDDGKSGRVMEYLWHVIFGQEAVYCPSYQQCRCDVYNEC